MATLWGLDNFRTGIHTIPRRVDGGELYANDMQNLQVNPDGDLHLLELVSDAGYDGAVITGLGVSAKYLFVLREDRSLSAIQRPTPETLGGVTILSNVAVNLSGRLSLVDLREYAILTSEGNDQGYWIDLREGNPNLLSIYPLGLNPPVPGIAFVGSQVDKSDGFSGEGWIGYILTWHRDAPGEPLDGMESNGTAYQAFELRGSQHTHFWFRAFTFPVDPQITHVKIYRVKEAVAREQDLSIYRSTYREVATVARGDWQWTDTGTITENEWSGGEALRNFNDRMPLGVKSLIHYNDRLYAPTGDELRFTDFYRLNPEYWRFEPKNSHRRGTRIDFCASYRDIILFGGPDGLYRVDGDGLDSSVDEIGSIGPVDGYSWGRLKNQLAFVGRRGVYLTDGSSVELVTDGALEGYFEGKKLTKGAIGFNADDQTIVSAQFDTGEWLHFLYDSDYWTRWEHGAVEQWASLSGELYLAGQRKLYEIRLDNTATFGTGRIWTVGSDIWTVGDRIWVVGDEEHAAGLEWVWESNRIDVGDIKRLKQFRELSLTALEDLDLTLTVYVENTEPEVIRFRTDEGLNVPQSVPVERLGKWIKLKLEGTGAVRLRSMELRGEMGADPSESN